MSPKAVKYAPWVAAATLALLVGTAWSQGAPRYRLSGGSLGSIGGRSSGGASAVVGESGTGLTNGRSSEIVNLIGGFIGQAYSPIGVMEIETGEAEFASIAFPLVSSSLEVADVLDELGEPDTRDWRLGHWSPSDSAYIEAGGDLSDVRPGQGYFLITAEPTTIVQEGLTVPVEEFEIEIEGGFDGRPAWNQLGNPFPFPIAVADLEVTDGDVIFPLTSAENTLTETAVKVYEAETNSYLTNPAVIEPRTAFWVKKVSPGPVIVVVPYQVGSGPEEKLALSKPPGAQWAIAVTARQGARRGEPLMVGAAPVRDGAWNSLCLSRTPDPPGGAMSLSLHQPDWGRLSGDYVRVFRTGAERMSWDFDARGVDWPGELTLQALPFDLPAGTRAWLGDPAGTWKKDVTLGGSFVVPAGQENRFRITVAPGEGAGAPPLANGLRFAYPNPFRGRLGLAFTVVNGGMVSASIFDVNGRSVRKLSARASTSGERVLVWDGRDESGAAAPPGVYLAHYRVNDAAGVIRLVKLQ